MQPERVDRTVVVTAHPDDVDFGAGGTIARWVEEGAEVFYCIVTDGDAGGSDPSVPRPEMAAIRREEQRKAAQVLGVGDVTFLGYPDGRLMPSIELRCDIARVIRHYRPDRLVCQSPERNWERIGTSHPDHRVAGDAALDAVYPDARNPFAHPELLASGLQPHVVKEVWVMGSPTPNTYVDVTDTFERKLAALRCHESQLQPIDDLEGMLRKWLASSARQGELPEGRLAEAFRRVPTG